MRILHTADWHLGRVLHGASLLDEQAAAVDAIGRVVRDDAVDVVLVAGDVYDRAIPPLEAVTLLDHALDELRGAGAVVVVTSGNHDSPVRLGFGRRRMAAAGVHLCTDVAAVGRPVLIADARGGPDLAVYGVPYLDPELARHTLGDPALRSHDAVVRAAVERCRADLATRGRVRSVLVAHCFASGGQPSESERQLAFGGVDRVGLDALVGFDYTALGHLHGRQVHGGPIRYAGSPLAYSFSEERQRKGGWLVDLPDGGPPVVTAVDLGAGRGVATVEGTLRGLLGDPAHAAAERRWVRARLTDPVLPRDAMAHLRRRFPRAVALEHRPRGGASSDGRAFRERVRGRDDLDLVTDFLRWANDRDPTDAEREDCRAALAAVAQQEVPA